MTDEILRDFIDNGPTEEQLSAAKAYLTGSFALRLNTNQARIANIAPMVFYGLPLDYLDTYTENVEAVTINQIQSAFHQHIDPDALVSIQVGAFDDNS